MSPQRVLLFDCMETLIDMKNLPSEKEYARWAFEGSGVEHIWHGFGEFYEHFSGVWKILKTAAPLYKEHSIRERFRLIVEKKLTAEVITNKSAAATTDSSFMKDIVEKLVKNYWSHYIEQCYIQMEVAENIASLANKYQMGVVSNFIVRDGVEELLALNGISRYFDFVVTSVKEGWRKPHPLIYQAALAQVQLKAEETIFIGDDYLNDYLIPQKLGFRTLFYDKKTVYPEIEERFTTFRELKNKLL